MKIVSFTGPKSSGKDTCAQILADEGISKGKISFAGPMKQILSNICGIPLSTFEDPLLKEAPLREPVIITNKFLERLAMEMVMLLSAREFDYENLKTMIRGPGAVLYTPRQLLQYVGTEVIRSRLHPDWHVAAAFRSSVLDNLEDGTYCVTDARFPNEFLWLLDRFQEHFKGFYVERREAELLLIQATHPSELATQDVKRLMPKSRILVNNGTKENLKQLLLTKLNIKEQT